MKKKLLTCLLVLLGAVCIVLMFIGTMAGIVLGLLGIIVFFGAASECMLDLAAAALFGLITVALASVCCFSGLMFLLDCCLNRLPPAHPTLDKPFALMSVAAVICTAALFRSTRGEYFETVCIAADCMYLLLIAAWFLLRRRKLPA